MQHSFPVVKFFILFAWFFSILSPDGVKLSFEYETREECLENRVIVKEMIGEHKGWVVGECRTDDKKA